MTSQANVVTYVYIRMCVRVRVMESYHILGRIGEGAHGIVLKAKHIQVQSLIQTILA